MHLFHFSDRSDIQSFVPRPVAIAAERKSGMDWLNGPLVWAIDDWHQPMYLFPRDCPRILFWPIPSTTSEDRGAHWPASSCRMVAYVEQAWLKRLFNSTLYRYTLPSTTLQSLQDAGMWVSAVEVIPSEVQEIRELPAALDDAGVYLRVVPSLEPFKMLIETTFHVSCIRLRNAGIAVVD